MSEAFRVGPAGDPDRYSLVETVGAGSEGVLYKGTITVASGAVLPVAVKMLHPNHRSRLDEWRRRWSEQVELLRSLQAPGVVTVRDGFVGPLPHPPRQAGAEGTSTLYLVMNWLDGEPLDAWVDGRQDLAPNERLRLLLPVASALDLMHSGHSTGGTPVIHGDVKPSNILVTSSGHTVLVDFGLAKCLPDGLRSSAVTGTPGYLAPELAAEGTYSPAADRYALGAVAYFLLTGEEPPTQAAEAVLVARLEAVQPRRTELVGHLMRMLAHDPDARPQVLANWCAQLRNSSLEPSPGLLTYAQ